MTALSCNSSLRITATVSGLPRWIQTLIELTQIIIEPKHRTAHRLTARMGTSGILGESPGTRPYPEPVPSQAGNLLEQEVTEFLGRAKSARRSREVSDRGYRNGCVHPRKLTLASGTIEVRRCSSVAYVVISA